MIWFLVGVTYIIIFLCLISCYNACGAYESHAHIGPISSVVAFELLHVVIFWFSLFLLIGGAGQPRKLVYVGLFITEVAYMYAMTWVGPLLYYKRYIQADKEIFSKQEVTDVLNQQLREPPTIEIRIKCFCHPDLTNGSKFVFMPLQ